MWLKKQGDHGEPKCLMKFISWNIRGMGSEVKKRFVSKLISHRNLDFMLIQESKME